MYRAALPIAALLIAGADGFRVKQKKRVKARRSPGQVDGLFPFGSPGSAEPGLRNARGGPCFPGKRFWTAQQKWYGKQADLATTVTGVLGFRHPELTGVELDLGAGTAQEFACDAPQAETPNLPRGLPVNLHDWQFYIDGSQNMSELLYNVSNMGVRESFTLDREAASRNVAAYGWTIAGSALDEGSAVYVGQQVSHLIQQPDTKECILTFQGSSSAQDWTANANVRKVSFCGLEGESLVHQGFRDALRAMVQNADWQSDVRPKLPTCSKVYVTGHSLGGAQAELFAACAQKAPQPGESGYQEDYQYIGW